MTHTHSASSKVESCRNIEAHYKHFYIMKIDMSNNNDVTNIQGFKLIRGEKLTLWLTKMGHHQSGRTKIL